MSEASCLNGCRGMKETDLLKDKVIVVSGGTKGVGKGVCIEAARQGACVVFGGRDSAAAEKIVNEISGFGGEALFVRTDLFSVDDMNNLFEKAYEKFGKIDGFVNYAGLTYAGTIVECEEKTFDDIFAINVKAPFFLIQNAIKYMRKNGGGSIVLFGSTHDDKGEIDRAAYACSKAALSVMSTHVAKHYASDGIRINYITMGWTPTEGELTLRAGQGISESQLRQMAHDMVPAGKMQEVEDYLPAVMYLLSDFSMMTTGSNIRIAGGLYF